MYHNIPQVSGARTCTPLRDHCSACHSNKIYNLRNRCYIWSARSAQIHMNPHNCPVGNGQCLVLGDEIEGSQCWPGAFTSRWLGLGFQAVCALECCECVCVCVYTYCVCRRNNPSAIQKVKAPSVLFQKVGNFALPDISYVYLYYKRPMVVTQYRPNYRTRNHGEPGGWRQWLEWRSLVPGAWWPVARQSGRQVGTVRCMQVGRAVWFHLLSF